MLRESPNLFSTRKEVLRTQSLHSGFPEFRCSINRKPIWSSCYASDFVPNPQSDSNQDKGNARRSELSVSESKAKYMFLPFIDIQIARHNDQRKFYDEMDRSIINTRVEVTTKTWIIEPTWPENDVIIQE